MVSQGGGSSSVKVTHYALDEVKVGGKDDVVLRGVIDPGSLSAIKVDDYQREILSGVRFESLVKAFQAGDTVQDITLGMRGARVMERSDAIYLQDDVFVIDGLQRIQAAMRAMQEKPDTVVHLGAVIYFETEYEWEQSQFEILNLHRTKVSPNVLLRNMRGRYPVVATLFTMSCDDKGFALHDRVCWTQRMRRSDAVSALTMLKTLGVLHAHIGPGRSNKIDELIPGMQQIMERVGRNTFRENTRTFFDLVDGCWGIRQATYSGSTQLKGTFLRCLAMMFSNHAQYFFKDNKLVVDVDTRRKLAQFPVGDQNVTNLAGSSGKGSEILYILLIKHVDKGRRTRRMVAVDSNDVADESDDHNGESGEE
ncbi:MAG: hypothetical protein AAB476_03095 [Patescibacteria group bacterium]